MAGGTIAELLVKLGVRLDGSVKADAQLRKLKKRAHEFGDQADTTAGKVRRLAAGVGRTLVRAAKVGVVAVGVYGAALGKLVAEKSAAIDATNKFSAALGINIEELQRLEFAAGQSGLSQGNLHKGVRNLNKAINEMAQGAGGVAKKAFDDLGLSLDDLDGYTQAEQIGIIGDALNKVENEGQRSALAAQIFGMRAGPEMATLLAQGSKGLQELMAQTRGVFTQEQADRASAMQDRIGELKNTVEAFSTSIAVELIPMATEWIQAAQRWFDRNEDIIRQDFAATVSFVVDVVRELAGEGAVLIDIVRGLVEVFESAGGRGDLLGDVISGLAWAAKQALRPLQNVRTLLGELAYLFEELGVISGKTADDFNRSIGNMEVSAQGLDRIAGKYDNLGDAAFDAAAAMKMAKAAETLYGKGAVGPVSEAEMQRAKELEREARYARRPRVRRSGGGGSRRPKREAKREAKAKKPKPDPVTLEQLRRRLLTGDLSAMRENLSALSSSSASIADTKPSVVIHHTDNSVHVGRVDMHVDGAGDPTATGKAAARALVDGSVRAAIRRANAKAANRIPNTVVR